jgi:hypothetical protein
MVGRRVSVEVGGIGVGVGGGCVWLGTEVGLGVVVLLGVGVWLGVGEFSRGVQVKVGVIVREAVDVASGVWVGLIPSMVPVVRGVIDPVGEMDGEGEGVTVQVVGVGRVELDSRLGDSAVFLIGGNWIEVLRIGCSVSCCSAVDRFCLNWG